MNKMTKRIFALLLTVCSLLSVMSPVVFADTAQTPTGNPVTATYDFGYSYFSGAVANNTTNTVTVSANVHNFDSAKATYNAIVEAYGRDTNGMNWRVGEFNRVNVNNTNTRFSSVYGMRFNMAPLDSTATATNGKSLSRVGTWVSFPIKSPEPGTYSFTIDHGTHKDKGMQEVGVYIVSYTGSTAPSKADIDSVLSGTAVSGVSVASVGTYSCDSASGSETPATMVKDYALSSEYTFKRNANHILVLKCQKDTESESDTTIDTNVYISKLVLTQTAPEQTNPDENDPTESTTTPEEIKTSTLYNFDYLTTVTDKGLAAGGAALYKNGALISGFVSKMEGYYADEDFQNWKYAGLNMSGNVEFDKGYCMVASAAEGDWVAFYMKTPGAGEYDVYLDYYRTNYGATASEIYIIPVPSIAAGADMNAAIQASLLEKYRLCDDVSYHSSAYSSANPSKKDAQTLVTNQQVGSWTAGADQEYIVVFKATAQSTTKGREGKAFMYPRQLALTEVGAQPPAGDDTPATIPGAVLEADGSVIYNMDYITTVKSIDPSLAVGGSALYKNGVLTEALLANMDKYYAGVEQGSANYTYAGLKMTGNVEFDAALNKDGSVKKGYCMVASTKVGDWVAFRIKTPGAGSYKVRLDYYGTVYGATASEIYIIPNITDAKDMNAAIEASLTEQYRISDSISYHDTGYASANPSKKDAQTLTEKALVGEWTTDGSASEYILVFKATAPSTTKDKESYATLYPAKLHLIPTAVDVEPEKPSGLVIDSEGSYIYNLEYISAVKGLDERLAAGGNALYKNGALVENVAGNMDRYYSGIRQGALPWTYVGAKLAGTVEFGQNYSMAAYTTVGEWVAIKIKAPAAGDYQLCLDYYGTNYGATNSAVYIIPNVTGVADMNAYIEAALVDEYLIGDKVSYWKSSYASANPAKNQATTLVEGFPVGMWSTDGSASEYIVVFKALAESATESRAGMAYMYPKTVTLRPAANARPQNFESVVALADAVSTPTCQAAITSVVNGHDYIYMFLKGNKVWVYDLDTKELVDSETNGFGTPRAAVVDANGIVWACGASRYLYRYDPYTGIGEQIPFTVAAEGGVTSFNALGITTDENGMIYFGSYNRGNLFMYNPQNGEFTNLSGWLDITPDDGITSDIMYAGYGGLVVRDGYIYCGVDGDVNADQVETHAMIKFSIAERRIVDVLDLSECWTAGVYFGFMNEVGDYLLCGSNSMLAKTIAVDISGEKMKLVDLDGDMKLGFSGFVSGELDGKLYCLGNTKQEQGMFEIDPDSMYVKELNKSFFPYNATKLTCWGDSVVTVEQGIKLKGESLITYYNDAASQSIDLIFYNPKTKFTVTWDDFTGDSPSGNQLQALTVSPDGTKIYAGSYGCNYLTEFDVLEDKVTKNIQTYDHQIDKLLWYNDHVYVANYQSCTITVVDPNKGTTRPLFAIKNTAFNQYRMHSLAAGDGKVFGGTTPSSNRWGGVLVWYDFEQDLTYVAAGPNPEDVYYCDTSYAVNSNRWKSVLTDELTEFSIDILDPNYDPENPPNAVELYANVEVDGKLKQRFYGLIENQCINSMVYKDGYIYGSTTIYGGSGTNPFDPPEDITISNACLFVYDVAAMKVVATYDLCNAIEGLKASVQFIESIQEDPLVEGKFWGVVSDTLFSYTFDHATNTFNVTEELSFGKASYNHGGDQLCGREIVFDGNYMYVSFGDAGLYMINRNNLEDCVRLSVDIPKHMVLAADGNLYYTDGTVDLKMIEVGSYTQPIVASNFQPLLDSLPEEVTAENADYVNRISKAYEALSDVATAAMDPTRLAAAEEKAAAVFQAQLDEGIPSILHTSDISRIRALRYAYQKLSGRIQALISTYNLICAEQVLGIHTGSLNYYTGDNVLIIFFVGLAISAGALLTLLYYRKRKYARK